MQIQKININFDTKNNTQGLKTPPTMQANHINHINLNSQVSFGMALIDFSQLKKEDDFKKTGNTDAHLADARKLKEILQNNTKKYNIEMFFTPNKYGRLPIHGAKIDKLQVILDELKGKNNLIDKIFFTPDRSDNLPIHLAGQFSSKLILDSCDQDLVEKMLFAENRYQNLPIHLAGVETTKVLLNALDDGNLIADMLLSTNRSGLLPINCGYALEDWESKDGKQKVILNKIMELATQNEDVSEETSLKLLQAHENYLDKDLKLIYRYLQNKLDPS